MIDAKVIWKFFGMKSWLLLISILFMFGCGKMDAPASSAGSNAPSTSTPATATKPADKDVAKDVSEKKSDASGKNWSEIVAAAEKEGKIIISGAPSENYRKALAEAFEKKYPAIKVEYIGLNGRDFWPKVIQERKVGQYLWDLRMGTADTLGWDEAKKITKPIRPLLLPEIADDKVWLGGLDGLFADKENQYVPGYFAYAASPVSANRDFIAESELSSPQQLLDPKFKGKIVINDPRGGAGLGYLTVLMKSYGEQFLQDLLTKQDVVITKDNRQLVEWAVRGRYPIVIGLDSIYLGTFQEKGLGQNVKDLSEGPIGISLGFGAIMLLDQAPHPNAAAVYMNWLLSKEGQSVQAQMLKLNSRRLDVPPGDKELIVDPQHMERYIPHQEEELAEYRVKAQKIAAQLIKQ